MGLEEGDVIKRIKYNASVGFSEYTDVEITDKNKGDVRFNADQLQTEAFTVNILRDPEGGTLEVRLVNNDGRWIVTEVEL